MIVRLTETVSRDGSVVVQGRVLGRLGGQGRDHGGLPLHHLQRDLLHKFRGKQYRKSNLVCQILCLVIKDLWK